ncbi:MAG: heavy-metal-associated domain-containing protein [Proteobacteria bacterium]|nr:heavy-metal-associated domain-containing protein [Pseudomonadota bacterium]
MKRAGLIALLLLAGPAFAAEPRTVTLGVEHMTCAACPITVRKALSHVAGVSASTVDMKAHTATVTFDPTRTSAEALATAISQAGFPAKVLSSGS